MIDVSVYNERKQWTVLLCGERPFDREIVNLTPASLVFVPPWHGTIRRVTWR